ncbi:MAG: DUF7467 domain-containing protein, partial [Planctomycetota bacterium]
LDGSCCDFGKPSRLTMMYTGDDCSATMHQQAGNKVSCEDYVDGLPETVYVRSTDKSDAYSNGGKVWFEGVVSAGDIFDIDAANEGKKKLKSTTWIHVFDESGSELLQSVKFHTSCSQPLSPGDQYGSALLLDCVGEDEPIEGDCCAFGKPRALTMEYTGDDCSATMHGQDDNKVRCDDYVDELPETVYVLATDKSNPSSNGAKVWFEGVVSMGQTFDIDAANEGKKKLKSTTWIHVFDESGSELLQSMKFNTSCSQPLIQGDQFGSALLVDCVGEDEPVEGDCCDAGKPRMLSMEYTGDDCSATMHGQADNKVSCDDYIDGLPDTVFVLATDKSNPNSNGAKVWFEGVVSMGETFDIDAANEGKKKLKSTTWIHVFDETGLSLLQSVKFHTSCSQPLVQGDQFGSARLADCIGEDEDDD